MSREPYTYLILRYRHDALAGEQINVGVVVHAPKSRFLGSYFRKVHGRVSKAFPDVNGPALRHDLAGIERAFQRLAARESDDIFFDSQSASTLAHRIVGKDDSALVWSEMGSGVSTDPPKTLDTLVARFVTQYDEAPTFRRSDADIWKPFRDRLAERQIADIFERKTIRSSRDEVEFEHAWKNGEWHCFQPLSFDLAGVDGIQEKAARWVGHMVGLTNVADQFRPYFIVGAPSDQALTNAYHRALAFIGEAPLSPKVVQEADFEAFADSLANKVNQHGTAQKGTLQRSKPS
jgi:hypothetical protein